MTTNQQVASTILEQLGGGRFVAMTGACYMTAGDQCLNLRFKGSKAANHLTVKLEPSDTYTLTFGKVRGMNYTKLEPITGVYAEDLQRIFTSTTGLHTRLF